MAITVISTPLSKEYVYNSFHFVLSSNNSTKLNFEFIADIYCSHSGLTNDIYVGQFDFPVRPQANSYGYFSPSRILQSYVSHSTDSTITEPQILNEGLLVFKIYWGEEYDNSPTLTGSTGTTIYTGLTYSTGVTLNAFKQYDEVNNLDVYDGVTNAVSAFFLTDWFPAYNKPIRENEWETLTVFNSSPGLFDTQEIYTFNISGDPLGQYTFTVSDLSQMRYSIPSGTANLNQSAFNIILGSPDSIINSNVAYYQIRSYNSTNQLSIEYFYIIDRSCQLYTPTRLKWRGSKGGDEYFTFENLSRKTLDFKRTEWEKKLSYNYLVGERGRTTLFNEAKTKLILNTGWLTDVQYNYLVDSLLSKGSDVSILKADGSQIPVIVTTTSDEIKTREQDRLLQFSITIEHAFDIATSGN